MTASRSARRTGYVIAIGCNALMLWVAANLLEWGWPGFLTEDFDQILPIVSLSFAVSIVANACFLWRDDGWFRALADMVTAAFALAVSVATWRVFPFDFSGYSHDWSGAFRVALVLSIIATGIAVIVNATKLIWRCTGHPGTPRRPPDAGVPRQTTTATN